MIIIYILAAIGGLCVLGTAGLLLMIAIVEKNEKRSKETSEKCALTGEECIHTDKRQNCNDCPTSEEATK